VRFLVDAQLPPALARFLSERGHEAVAVRELSLRDGEDDAIWEVAKRGSYIVVTKDEDFARMALRLGPPPQVLWLRLGNATNKALLSWLEPILSDTLVALEEGNALVEVI
jgi:predicted nuclease of predicted toxin-antitoxin system